MSISPFVTTAFNQKRPFDYTYSTPVYDNTTDDDGNLVNAGDILVGKVTPKGDSASGPEENY